jgi:hypothetical protein
MLLRNFTIFLTHLISLNRFPYSDPNRMLKWLELCPPDLTTDKGRILLCSRHFRRDQYLNINAKKPKLVHDAVPFKKRNLINSNLSERTEQSETATTTNQKDPNGKKPLVWIPLPEDILEVKINSSSDESSLESIQEEIEDSLTTVEVEMKDDDSNDSVEFVKDDHHVKNNIPANQAIILENIRLKLDNEELQTELDISKQRLAFLERHVHSLSRLTGECECVCSTCTNDSNSF